MNFNSPEFLFFLPGALFLYAVCFRSATVRNVCLLVISYAFYMSWNWKYAGLLACATVVDYSVGLLLAREYPSSWRKAILTTSLTWNIGLLAVFKYFNFFVDLGEPVATVLGIDVAPLRHHLLLPVGISFYTFQTMSYTIDLYRDRSLVERNFLKFSVFVAFFPQLIAGPIVRANQFLPQLQTTPRVSEDGVHAGLCLVFRGLFKKVVLADLLANLAVDEVFARPADFSSWDLLLALYGYTFQIYNDFSGYSDIAIGLAKILGFQLPTNFDRPYLSQNIREFWTRWHITLSTWLRDYLYIPLGGNRGGAFRVGINLVTTMLLGGLWHGASLHFVAWGLWHGLWLVLGRSGPRVPPEVPWYIKALKQIQCFHVIVFGWLLFRVQDWQGFVLYMKGFAKMTMGTQLHPLFYSVLGLAIVIHVVPKSYVDKVLVRLTFMPIPAQACVYACLLLFFCGLTLEAPSFIYFQF